jgi:hypothetical protein
MAELEKELGLALKEEQVKSLFASAPEIDERRFRLRGVRTQPLNRRQTKTTQYRVV